MVKHGNMILTLQSSPEITQNEQVLLFTQKPVNDKGGVVENQTNIRMVD